MNLRKKLATVRYNRSLVAHEKNLFETKMKAIQPKNWDMKRVQKLSRLINDGDGNYHHSWIALYDEDKPFTFASLTPNALKNTAASEVLRLRSVRAYKQRNDVWKNVFDFLPDDQIPTLAGCEYALGDGESSEGNPSVGVATFGYPSMNDPLNPGKEFQYANYGTYYSKLETIRNRMGLNDVYVEPVGIIRADGTEICGTVGNLGFRVWWSPNKFSPKGIFEHPRPFTSSIKIRTSIIGEIRKLDGFDKTFKADYLTYKSKEYEGSFHLVVVASDKLKASDYMGRADEILSVLDVPGLMIAPFGPLGENRRLESAVSEEADSSGIYHTAFIFYTGEATEVAVEADEEIPSVTAGFMPVHSASRILSKWAAKEPVAAV